MGFEIGRVPILESAAAVELKQLTLGWSRSAILENLSGRFEKGSMTAIVGPNGAGKSTLIKGIAGILQPLSGRVLVEAKRFDSVAWLPQTTEIDSSFPISVFDVVALGALRRVGPWGRYSNEEIERVTAVLKTVELSKLANRQFEFLSGGQKQCALFARMLLQNAQILLLDEPFSTVDYRLADKLTTLLCKLHKKGRTIITVLHDLDLVRKYFPETLLLMSQGIQWGSTQEVLFNKLQSETRS